MLSEKEVEKVFKKYKLKIKMNEFIKLSLTHSSYANEHNLQSNERLEFLGDSILGFLVAEYLYAKFPNIPEASNDKVTSYLCM